MVWPEKLASITTGPWLCMRDFNIVLHITDRTNGNPIHENETRDFQEFLNETNMTEIRAVVRNYT